MDFWGIGPLELLLIVALAFLLLGPGKLQEIARGLGKAVREFKKYSSALTKDFRDEIEKETNVPHDIQKENTVKSDETLVERKVALTKTEGVQTQSANER